MDHVNGFTSKAQVLRYLRDQGHKFTSLLTSPEANPKVAKNGKEGVLTAPLHLAPFDLSGFQVCPQASAGCAAACLHTAGNPAYMKGKDASRKDKTLAYFKHRDAFLALLVFEIEALERKAERLGMETGIRLNATSDLPWEVRTVSVAGGDVKLMELFPHVNFYDYTKVTKRALAFADGRMPKNYHLTFSKTEDNDADCGRVLAAGGNVAVVCDPEVYKVATVTGRLPFPYDSVKVIDGDAHDFRPVDGVGVVVALKAKGDAKTDTSGFVLRA